MRSSIIEAIAEALKNAGQTYRPALQPVPVRNNPRFGK